MNEDQVRQIIREEIAQLFGVERYTFQKHIQMFDGRNIQLGKGTGTKIGTETTQKLGFFNATPVDQPDTVSDATGCAGDADDKVNDLIDRLQELGLIA